MIPDSDWITLMKFMAQEIIDLAVQQHPEITADDNHRLFHLVREHVAKFNLNEVIMQEVETKLGQG